MCAIALRVGGKFKENSTENGELLKCGVFLLLLGVISLKLAAAVENRGRFLIRSKPQSSE